MFAAGVSNAAVLIVDIRFETERQSIWNSGHQHKFPTYNSGNDLVLDNGDIVRLTGVNPGNIDFEYFGANVVFRSGLEVEFSGDVGRADAALTYDVGLEFAYSDLVADNWVEMRLVRDLDQSVLSTEFPQIRLRADLVFQFESDILVGGDVVDHFGVDSNNLVFGGAPVGRLIGLNVNGDGKIELLPAVHALLDAGNAIGRLTPDVELDLEVEQDDRNRTQTDREAGESSQKDDSKKKVKTKFSLKPPSPVSFGSVLDVSVRLPEIETFGVGDALTPLTTSGSDDFLDVTLDIDNLISLIPKVPPFEAEVSLLFASVYVNLLDLDLNGSLGVAQNFGLTAGVPAQALIFNQPVEVRVGEGEESIHLAAFQSWQPPADGVFQLMWTNALDSASMAGSFSVMIDTDAPQTMLSNTTSLRGDLDLEFKALFGNVTLAGEVIAGIDPLIGPFNAELISGEIAQLYSETFELQGFGCVTDCEPTFFLDTSPLETDVNCSGADCIFWSSPVVWGAVGIGGDPSNEGLGVVLKDTPSSLRIQVGESFTIGSLVNEKRDLLVSGSLVQESGPAVTTFSNAGRIYVLNGGELEIHAPITGGRDGRRALVMGGGTLRGDIDIASHSVLGSGLMETSLLRVAAGSSLWARGFCDQIAVFPESGGCSRNGQLTIRHTGGAIVNEGRIGAGGITWVGEPSATVTFESDTTLTVMGSPDRIGTFILDDTSTQNPRIVFDAPLTELKHQRFEGPGEVLFESVLINDVALAPETVLVAENLTLETGLQLPGRMTVSGNIESVVDPYADLYGGSGSGSLEILDDGFLHLQLAGTEMSLDAGIANRGLVRVDSGLPGFSNTSVVRVGSGANLLNEGEILLGDAVNVNSARFIFEAGSTLETRGHWTIDAGSTLEFMDAANQWPELWNDGRLTNVRFDLEWGDVLLNEQSIDQVVSNFGPGGLVRLAIGEGWNAPGLLTFEGGTSGAGIIENRGGVVSGETIRTNGCAFLPLHGDPTLSGCGGIRGRGFVDGILDNGGLLLATDGELRLDGPLAGNGWVGAAEGGRLELNGQNLFHADVPPSATANLIVQGDGRIELDRPMRLFRGNLTLRNLRADGGIGYTEDCANCTPDDTEHGFLHGLSTIVEGGLHVESSHVVFDEFEIGFSGLMSVYAQEASSLVRAETLSLGDDGWLLLDSADAVFDPNLRFLRTRPSTAGNLKVAQVAVENLTVPAFGRVEGSGVLWGSPDRLSLLPITATLDNEGIVEARDGSLSLVAFNIINSGEIAASSGPGLEPGHLDIRSSSVEGGLIRAGGGALLTIGRATEFTGVHFENAGDMWVYAADRTAASGFASHFNMSDVLNTGRIHVAGQVHWTDSQILNLPAPIEIDGVQAFEAGVGELVIDRLDPAPIEDREVYLELDSGEITDGAVLVGDGELRGSGTVSVNRFEVRPDGVVMAQGGDDDRLTVRGGILRNRGELGARSGSLELTELELQGSGVLGADDGARVTLRDVRVRGAVIDTVGDVVNAQGSVLTVKGRATLERGTLRNDGVLRNEGVLAVAAEGVVAGVGSWLQRAGTTVVNGVAGFLGFRVEGGDVRGSGTLEGNVTLANEGATLLPGLALPDARAVALGEDVAPALEDDGLLTIVGNLVTRAGTTIRTWVGSATEYGKLLVTGVMQIAGSIVIDVTASSLELLDTLTIGDLFLKGDVANPRPVTAQDVADVPLIARTVDGNVRVELDGDQLRPQGEPDTTPPVVMGGPAMLVMDATGPRTAPDDTGVSALDDVDGALPVFPVVNGRLVAGFPSGGPHEFMWAARDSAGNTGMDEALPRQVTIRPLAGVAARQRAAEGSNIEVEVRLSGPAATYPVMIPYVVSGTTGVTDHDLADGTLAIAAGTVGTIAVAIAADAEVEGDETLIVTLGDSVEAAISERNQHVVTIVEGNLPPRVRLEVAQGGENSRVLPVDGGVVAVTATALDPNGDGLAFDWTASDAGLMGTPDGNTLTFDPADAGVGVFRVVVSVTDDGAPNQTTTRPVLLRVVQAAPPVIADDDTDGDGVSDGDEGTGDSDGDGVPDYRDPSDEPNVLPSRGQFAESGFMRADPGLRLKLGARAFASGADGASIDIETLRDVVTDPGLVDDRGFKYPLGVFDFVVEDLAEPGETVALVLPLTSPVPMNATFRKFDDATGWRDFVSDGTNSVSSAGDEFGLCPESDHAAWEPGLVAGSLCLRLVIQDGGPNDTDGVMDGRVEDPSAVAAPSDDTDGDGMPDDYEDANGLDKVDPADANLDADGDTLTNLEEFEGGTNPQNPNDPDVQAPVLTVLGDDPLVIVVGDAFEDPGVLAEDNVELEGLIEVSSDLDTAVVGDYTVTYTAVDTSGNEASATRTVRVVGLDTDGDELPDAWEIQHGFDPEVPDADEDADLDGLTNLEEFLLGLGPRTADSDNDGVNDGDDDLPLDQNESVDTDGDGIGNEADMDDDGDGVYDEDDSFPQDPAESSDADGDGIGDVADPDDDNDGAPDDSDAFPLDPAESVDTDEDGIGNNADDDDDDDGVPDAEDALPLDASETSDADGDGVGDIADDDDDNDGVTDDLDQFPLDPSRTLDTDLDGLDNTVDEDDDGDQLPDQDETDYYLTDPLDPDSDDDGLTDHTEIEQQSDPLDASSTTPGPGRPSNIATRGLVLTGNDVLIGGFIVEGEPKRILVRARGPSLAEFGVSGVLADPHVELYDQAGNRIDENDSWMDHPRSNELNGDALLQPTDEREAIVIATLPAGGYTAIVRGVGGTTGIGIVEAFELPANLARSRFLNIATRGIVGTGDNVLIGGVIIGGNSPTALTFRARSISLGDVAPELAGRLVDVEMQIFDVNGNMIAENDDWQQQEDTSEIPLDLRPTEPSEATVTMTLPPGAYTAIVRGKSGAEGLGIIEVFNR